MKNLSDLQMQQQSRITPVLIVLVQVMGQPATVVEKGLKLSNYKVHYIQTRAIYFNGPANNCSFMKVSGLVETRGPCCSA